MRANEIEGLLFKGLTANQRDAVKFPKRRLLVVAGAGSGKTEVMARRIAWWVGVKGVSKDNIIAFTFTERAAEEMKFRIRSWIEKITPDSEEVALGNVVVIFVRPEFPNFCDTKAVDGTDVHSGSV